MWESIFGGPDRGQSVKYVTTYPVSAIIPDWVPPEPVSRKVISAELVPTLQQKVANGKSIRELAMEVGVSHETVRTALKAGEIGGAKET